MKVTSLKIAKILSTNRNIKLIKQFAGKIIIFLLDCHMLIKRLEKYNILWLMLLIIQQMI